MGAARVLSCRLEGSLSEKFDAFVKKYNLSQSQALRTLLELGLSRGERLDEDWAKASFREGQLRGADSIHTSVQQILRKDME